MALTGEQAYAIAKNYVDKTLVGMGALKGAPCRVASVIKQDGQNIVTLEWTDADGNVSSSVMIVKDGTPIYEWVARNTYKPGDLAIYQSAFYRCTKENADPTFNPMKWEAIGSSDDF